MSRKIASIFYEKEITDTDYDNFFESLKGNEIYDIFLDFKGQISNSNVKCKKCKTTIKDMVYSKVTVCECCFETIHKLIENKKFKPNLIYSDFVERFFDSKFKYNGKIPKYCKIFFENQLKIIKLKKDLEHSIEIEEYVKCELLKNSIEDLNRKNFELRRKINE